MSSSSSHQVIIICLVILDALLVLAELLLDLKIIEPDKKNYVVKVCTRHKHTWYGYIGGTAGIYQPPRSRMYTAQVHNSQGIYRVLLMGSLFAGGEGVD